jgi:hypothetical protein
MNDRLKKKKLNSIHLLKNLYNWLTKNMKTSRTEISLKYKKKSQCLLYASILYNACKKSIIQETICDITLTMMATVLK